MPCVVARVMPCIISCVILCVTSCIIHCVSLEFSLFDSLARNENKEMTPAKPPVKQVAKSGSNLMGITGKNNIFSQVCGAFCGLFDYLGPSSQSWRDSMVLQPFSS